MCNVYVTFSMISMALKWPYKKEISWPGTKQSGRGISDWIGLLWSSVVKTTSHLDWAMLATGNEQTFLRVTCRPVWPNVGLGLGSPLNPGQKSGRVWRTSCRRHGLGQNQLISAKIRLLLVKSTCQIVLLIATPWGRLRVKNGGKKTSSQIPMSG